MNYEELFIESKLLKLLPKKELYSYLEQCKQGNLKTREQIIIHNIRLVLNQIIKKFANTSYDKKDNDKSTDKEEDNKTEKETYNVANKDELLKEGFKELDLNKTEKTYRKNDKHLEKLDTDLEKLKEYDRKNELEKISFENGKFIYDYDNGAIHQEIDNVKEVKYHTMNCVYYRYIFVITNNNKVWYQKRVIGENYSEFKELKGNYVDVSSLYINSSTCGAFFWYLLKDTSGVYYNLNIDSKDNTFKEELYDNNIFYVDSKNSDITFRITNDRNIYYNGEKSNVIFKFGLYDFVIHHLKYFVSEDNYLYNVKMEKYSNSKIETILVKGKLNIVIDRMDYYYVKYFEDGTYFDMKYNYTTGV